MSQQTIAHIISHTHWDREWYLPYEKHHVRLVALMDRLLETLAADPEYRSFHLDGQTIMLEDYLQVRPEMRETLAAFIRAGRIHIGPWYVLQDEFLTSSEANVRNLLYGHRDAKSYGAISKLGYFPDSFGNMGQAAQLLQQAGIDTAVFGRGVKPTGFNNTVTDSDSYESPFSEMVWQSPDGSSVLGILFANWYSNGNEVPVDEEEAHAFWTQKLADARKYAATNQLLFMNGCDHQPVQTDLSTAIRVAQKVAPDVTFIHSNFADYVREVKRELPQDLKVVQGELRSQRTDGWSTLVNTASSRIYLKQLNQRGQTLLEKVAEPLAACAYVTGETYPHHLFAYAWKTLMQNHPHDSICGCSVDEVHREMVTRFDKSRHVGEAIVADSLRKIGGKIDTQSFATRGEDVLSFAVFNTSAWQKSGTVTVQLDVKRIYFSGGYATDEMQRRLQALSLAEWQLIDVQGRTVACTVDDLGVQFGYDLPDDKFRQPYMARRVRLTFGATEIPAFGYAVYTWVRGRKSTSDTDSAVVNGAATVVLQQRENELTAAQAQTLLKNERTLENAYVRVDIAADGSLAVTEKAGGHTFRDLCVYEDVGDIGNEYMFKQPDGDVALTTKGLSADICVVEDTPYRATVEIRHQLDIPVSANEALRREQEAYVWFTERKAQRAEETVPLTIVTRVSLEKSGRGVTVQASFDNKAKDHRLRMLFPTDLVADQHEADSIFEVARRDNTPAPEWKNPSNCQHQQAFVSVNDGAAGLTIANKGLNEYEILRDGRNTIAVTLLRSVGEMGDWGVFPTPEAQCLGEHTVEVQMIPHQGDGLTSGAYVDAYQFQIPWSSEQLKLQGGSLPSVHAFVAWGGASGGVTTNEADATNEGVTTVAHSTLKVAEETGDVILRWFNMGQAKQQLDVCVPFAAHKWYKSNILEQRLEELSLAEHAEYAEHAEQAEHTVRTVVGGHEIVTLSVSRRG